MKPDNDFERTVQETTARETDRKDYLRVSGEDMIHVEKLIQGTSQKDELLSAECDSAIFTGDTHLVDGRI